MNFSPLRIVAAGWALIFAALHVLWASGSTFGLGAEASGGVFGWFLGYDVAVAIGCLVAVVVALWGRCWMLILVGAVPLIRGLIGIGQIIHQLIERTFTVSATLWVEPWILLGGVLFMIAARRPSVPLTSPAERS
jgi:hypothetical protein